MAFSDLYVEGQERRRQRLEDSRIARENMSTGCVMTCVIPLIMFFVLNGISAILYSQTGHWASFLPGVFGLVIFIGGLIALCIRYGDIHVPRPGQQISGPNGRPVVVQHPSIQGLATAPPNPYTQQHQQQHQHQIQQNQLHHLQGQRQMSNQRSPYLSGRSDRDPAQRHLMEGSHHAGPETPPPTYSLVMGTGRRSPMFDNIYQTDNKITDYGQL